MGKKMTLISKIILIFQVLVALYLPLFPVWELIKAEHFDAGHYVWNICFYTC